MSRTDQGAQPGLPFLEPRFSPTAFRLARLLSPLYIRLAEGIRGIEIEGGEALLEEYRRFERGGSRLFVAFRHPSSSDAPLVAHLFARELPALGRRSGSPLSGKSFLHFVYGRGVPLWAGPAGWILPRVAAIPVYRHRFDSKGLSTVRAFAVSGRFPIGVAPEGQVTYHNRRVGQLEAGVGRMAVWCRKDLAEAAREEEVRVLPISISYGYRERAAAALDEALRWLRGEARLPVTVDAAAPAKEIHRALREVSVAVLRRIESLYRPLIDLRFDDHPLEERVTPLCEAILSVGEESHRLRAEGSVVDRVFRLRDAGWKWMFRNDLSALSPLERGFADTLADQAKVASRHMELVDALEYLDPTYIDASSSLESFVEYALMLQDIANRLMGGTIAGRLKPKGWIATIRVGRTHTVGSSSDREEEELVTEHIEREFNRALPGRGEWA